MEKSIISRILQHANDNVGDVSPAAGLMFLLDQCKTVAQLEAFPREIDLVRHLLTGDELINIACAGAAKMMVQAMREERAA